MCCERAVWEWWCGCTERRPQNRVACGWAAQAPCLRSREGGTAQLRHVLSAGPSGTAAGPLRLRPARRGRASADGAPARPRRAGAGLQLQARARHVFREAARVPEFRAICHAPDAAPDAKLARLGALMDASQASCRCVLVQDEGFESGWHAPRAKAGLASSSVHPSCQSFPGARSGSLNQYTGSSATCAATHAQCSEASSHRSRHAA